MFLLDDQVTLVKAVLKSDEVAGFKL
jgi:hypothetical protein